MSTAECMLVAWMLGSLISATIVAVVVDRYFSDEDQEDNEND